MDTQNIRCYAKQVDRIGKRDYNIRGYFYYIYFLMKEYTYMSAMYWIYHDRVSDTRYYVEAYSMRATEFADYVSKIVGYKVSVKDTSQAERQRDLGKFSNIKHI